jgi:hypothetical protein
VKRALEESALLYAGRVKTSIIIVSDAGDERVPTPPSQEFLSRRPRHRKA